MDDLNLTDKYYKLHPELMDTDSDEFFEKYKVAVPKEAFTCGSMSNDEGEDISWDVNTNWDKIAFPIKYILYKKTDKGLQGDGVYVGEPGRLEADALALEYFEELGVECEVHRANPVDYIWTVVDCDDPHETYICQGIHHVNRSHYLMATVPYQEGDKETYTYMTWEDDDD